jgi:hypothetical protein
MTFTGQGAIRSDARVTVPDVLKRSKGEGRGRIGMSDFLPSPCAHPLCYQTCYLLEQRNGLHPFSIHVENIRDPLTDNITWNPTRGRNGCFKEVINEVWADKREEVGEEVLNLETAHSNLFPSKPTHYHEQQVIASAPPRRLYPPHGRRKFRHRPHPTMLRGCAYGGEGKRPPVPQYFIGHRDPHQVPITALFLHGGEGGEMSLLKDSSSL